MLNVRCQVSKQGGFTLVETLLYIAIAAVIFFVISSLLFVMFGIRTKTQTIAEVEQQGLAAMELITQTVRNAEAVTDPGSGFSGSSLMLDVLEGGNDPTVFDESSGVLRITEGLGGAVDLTNSRVAVSGLNFKNVSGVDSPGTIQISFTVTYSNTSSKNEYEYEKTFTSSASLR